MSEKQEQLETVYSKLKEEYNKNMEYFNNQIKMTSQDGRIAALTKEWAEEMKENLILPEEIMELYQLSAQEGSTTEEL